MIAGSKGLENRVEWVHIVEDIEVADFLNGKELVMTTGIGNIKAAENMMEYTKKLKEKNCSCLIFNIGPYIKEIPKNVIEYCNNNNMPLFTAPWDVKLVKLTRSLCQILVKMMRKKEVLQVW